MTLRSFTHEKRLLDHEGNLYVIHLNRREKDGTGAFATFIRSAPKGARVPPFDEEKASGARRTLFGRAARSASVRLGTLRELAGKPDWRMWWKERPVKVPATSAPIDAALVARALACAETDDETKVRVEVLVYPKGDSAFSTAALRITGPDWMAVVASRRPGWDPKPEVWKLWRRPKRRVTPRAKEKSR